MIPIGSYPYELWAREIRDLLQSSGFKATIDPRGPRAYQVLVPEKQERGAAEALASLGYFTCEVSPSLGSVKDWRPWGPESEYDEEKLEEIVDTVKEIAEDTADEMANSSAAMTWSTIDDTTQDELEQQGHKETWIIAEFGDQTAVNGDPIVDGPVPNPPEGFELTDRGGEIPSVEEHVDIESLMDIVHREAQKKLGMELEPKLVEQIIRREYGDGQEIPWSVSGETNIYAK